MTNMRDLFCILHRVGRLVLSALTVLIALAQTVQSKESQLGELRDFSASTTIWGSYLAGRQALRAGDANSAAVFFDNALRFYPGDTILNGERLQAALSAGDLERGLVFAREAVVDTPKDSFANLLLGIAAFKNGGHGEARRHFQHFTAGRIGELTAKVMIAWVRADAGDIKGAHRELDSLSKKKWAKSFIAYPRALLRMVSGDYKQALKAFGRANDYDRGNISLLINFAHVQEQAGNKKKAEETVIQLKKAAPYNDMVARASHAVVSGKSIPAVVTTAKEGASTFFYETALKLNRDRDHVNAIKFFQLAIMLSPNFNRARLAIADIHASAERFDLANEMLSQIPQAVPQKKSAELALGINHSDAGDLKAARNAMQVYTQKYPDDIRGYSTFGRILHSHEEYHRAAEIFSKALAIAKDNEAEDWRLYYRRGMSYERSKQWPQAEADFKKALMLSPDEPLVLNYLGYSWADMGEHLEKALEMLETAVTLRPNDGYIIDSFGWINYRIGRYEKALEHLERAVQLKPGDPVINDHLGDCYWMVGRRNEAKFQWNHAAVLDPEPELLEKIEKKQKFGLSEVESEINKPLPKKGG